MENQPAAKQVRYTADFRGTDRYNNWETSVSIRHTAGESENALARILAMSGRKLENMVSFVEHVDA